VQKQSLQRVNYEQQFAGNLEGEKWTYCWGQNCHFVTGTSVQRTEWSQEQMCKNGNERCHENSKKYGISPTTCKVRYCIDLFS
jgi:hypothetical protein